MDVIDLKIEQHRTEIVSGLKSKRGWTVVDNFISEDIVRMVRKEAEELRRNGYFSASKSERFDDAAQKLVAYEKTGVEAMQLEGGDQYFIAPRLHEYVVQITKSLAAVVNQDVSGVIVDDSMAANKLAVCLEDV